MEKHGQRTPSAQKAALYHFSLKAFSAVWQSEIVSVTETYQSPSLPSRGGGSESADGVGLLPGVPLSSEKVKKLRETC